MDKPVPPGRKIAITGASSGIGAALTKALASDGHRLFVCARRGDRLAEVTEGGRLAMYRAVDVGDESQVAAFADAVARETDGLDVLLCCAGGYGPIGLSHEVNSEAWWKALSINLYGTYLSIKRFVPLLSKGRSARIVTFSGGGAFNPLPNYSAYAVSKAGVVRLTETIAEELKPLGIAVNGVAPGFVRTEIHDATLAAGPEAAGAAFYAMTKAKMRDGAIPMEVPINCVRFLLSEAANGLTGKTLSASFDPWSKPEFEKAIAELNASDLYTMRRMNTVNLPADPVAQELAQAAGRA